MNIAIIGEPDTVLGFKSLGGKLFSATRKEEVINALEEIRKSKDYGIVFITENWFTEVKEEIKKFGDLPLPAIIPLPDQRGTTGVGLANISKIVEKAVGSDILKG